MRRSRLPLLIAAGVLLPHSAWSDSDKAAGSAVVLHQSIMDGLQQKSLDLRKPEAVLAAVFATLPAEVRVLPTENYSYWKLWTGGRELRGNLRLASGLREKGILSFGYAEFNEFPDDDGPPPEISAARYFDAKDGVTVTCPDAFTAAVTFQEKTVTFHLHRLPQLPPPATQLGSDERFIQRICDESGFQFYLLFNTKENCFLWTLAGDDDAPDHFSPLGTDCVLARRSGFIFWIDRERGSRKVLAGVRQASVDRNDWFDGPFDQLADNYADQSNIRHYIELALPACRGRVDKWGYFTDGGDRPNRVALNHYGTWSTIVDARRWMTRVRASKDPRLFISSRGTLDSK